MFTSADIRDRIKQTPFVPVRIITSSGQAYDITHPDLVMIGQRYLIVGVPSTEDPRAFETENRVSVLHVTDLQDLPPAAVPGSVGGNGSPK